MENALTSLKNDCRSCYKCIRACPTKSISFRDGQASIIQEECILCGRCYSVCPQNAKKIRDDLPLAKSLLASSPTAVASLAPSFLAAFPGCSFASMESALKKLGFAFAEETAVGATIVKKAYDELVDSSAHDVIISTCCHSVNLLVQKHYPSLIPCLAGVLSPMLAHAQDIKRRFPGAKVIFIGPCISKKNEADLYPGSVDCVLTFLELADWLKEAGVALGQNEKAERLEKSLARLFPIEGGILETMKKDNPKYDYVAVSGAEQCLSALDDIANGKVHHCFIEMSACPGSCVAGPAMDPASRRLVASYLAIKRQSGALDYETATISALSLKKTFNGFAIDKSVPSEEEIASVLRSIGKTSKKDELNCSSCGYASCRDKAIAVIKGKANLEMCLPFLMEKAKSVANNIVFNSPNGLLVLDENLVIQLINPTMLELVGAATSASLVGSSINSIMEPDLFADALAGKPVKNRRLYLAEYGRYVEATLVYDKRYHVIIGIYRDVTKETKQRQLDVENAKKTAEITDQVIEKNMRAVQEIASLLGKSTAETKTALTKLRNALKTESKDDE